MKKILPFIALILLAAGCHKTEYTSFDWPGDDAHLWAVVHHTKDASDTTSWSAITNVGQLGPVLRTAEHFGWHYKGSVGKTVLMESTDPSEEFYISFEDLKN